MDRPPVPSADPARPSSSPPNVQPGPGQRIFEDAASRIWSADVSLTPQSVEALLFTCITDPREARRALNAPPGFDLLGTSAESLRGLLSRAPKLGVL